METAVTAPTRGIEPDHFALHGGPTMAKQHDIHCPDRVDRTAVLPSIDLNSSPNIVKAFLPALSANLAVLGGMLPSLKTEEL